VAPGGVAMATEEDRMTLDEHKPESGRGSQSVDAGRAAVEAALRANDPAIQVADLDVVEGDDAVPVVQGRVGSETDRQWALTLAREALGRDVHDALRVDASLSASAPAEVVSGFEDQGGTDPEVDQTQGATGLLGSGAGPRRPRRPGEEDEHLGEPRPATEYLAPGLEQETTPEPPRSG
jgi:hypothetical protein